MSVKYLVVNLKYSISLFIIIGFFYSAYEWFLKSTYFQGDFKFPIIFTSILVGVVLVDNLIKDALPFFKAQRFDIILSIIYGILLGFFWDAVGAMAFPLLITLYLFVLLILQPGIKNRERENPLFLSDDPETENDKDVLGFEDDARAFAAIALNGGSSNPVVFGIDAPWGTGKSTYINFCKKYWREQEDIILFDFDALKFEDKNNLYKQFAQEFINRISEYSPEVESAFKRYSKIIKSVKFQLINFDISFDWSTESAFDRLKKTLTDLNKKVIVLVDDLDRLGLAQVKDVVDIVKKSYALPNVIYILCYSTSNFDSFRIDSPNSFTYEPNNSLISKTEERIDSNRVTEYFEKIINIKKTLVISRQKLKDYILSVMSSRNEIKNGYRLFSSESFDKIKEAIDIIFDPQSFDDYRHYIGDIRKVKRFLNIYLMQIADNSGLDLIKFDINFHDLFQLLLIYINYPDLFRRIYAAETDGASGLFSLNRNYDFTRTGKELEYINSKKFEDLIKILPQREAYLLLTLFSQKKYKTPTEAQIANSAAFNDNLTSSRNLEVYLNLIVNKKKPNPGDSYNFHIHKISLLLGVNGKSLKEVFEDPIYLMSAQNNGEKSRALFFRLTNSNIDQLDDFAAKRIIDYIINNFQIYSTYDNSDLGVGLRGTFPLYLLNFLNKKGWKDAAGKSYDNTNRAYLLPIAQRILGTGEHEGNGIFDIIFMKDATVLGLLDILYLRLFCSHDRNGGFYHVYDALGYHEDINSSVEGSVYDLTVQQMREVSQKCFSIFKKNYIAEGINFFDAVSSLADKAIFGESFLYLITKDVITDERIQKEKNMIISFVIYQLTNTLVKSGVGCGFYDETGREDQKGIRAKMNEYLFETCFNVSTQNEDTNKKNATYFVDYLMLNFERYYGNNIDGEYAPRFVNFTITLDQEKLKKYWSESKEKIIRYISDTRNKGDKVIHTYNYNAYYSQDLDRLFDVLDKGNIE